MNAQFAEPDADFDALLAEQAELQEKIDRLDAWNLDNHLEIAMEALGCPPPDTPVRVISGGERRRVSLTRLLLTEPGTIASWSRKTRRWLNPSHDRVAFMRYRRN